LWGFSHPCSQLSESITAIFAKRLKAARTLRGLSQRALGGLVSDSKSNGSVLINRYEQEVNRADMDTAAALAKALDVPLAYLFAEEEDQAELLLAFKQLSKAERSKLLTQAKHMADGHLKKES
jgi:transcriptional regulator with XRE-family HTH domain